MGGIFSGMGIELLYSKPNGLFGFVQKGKVLNR